MSDIYIPLEDCPIEAVLAKDLLNDNGLVILKAGTVLTESMIETISKYGAINIAIKSDAKLSQAEREEKMKKIEKNINKRMRRCEMSNEMNQLKNILINHYCREFL